MLQIHKIKHRSNLARRSQFQLFKPLSYETLDFQHSQNTKYQLLSRPRAVMILVFAHVNYVQQLCAIPMPEYTFLTYCRSRPGGVAKCRNGVLTLHAVHFFCAWRPRRASHFWFLQHLSCANACFACACWKGVAGVQVFHLQHAFGTHRTRVFEFEW